MHTEFYVNVHSSSVHNRERLGVEGGETPPRGSGEQSGVCEPWGTSQNHKMCRPRDSRTPKITAESRQGDTNEHILCDSIYIKLENCSDRRRIRVCLRWGGVQAESG